MNALIVLCSPKEGSFNHAIANVAASKLMEKGYEVIIHDLYREDFNPVLTQDAIDEKDTEKLADSYVINACKELRQADVIVIVHPNWWGQPPALLKGWIDCVFRMGSAYKFSEKGKAIGLLKAQKAYVFNTSNTPEDVEFSVYKDPLENLWKTCIFNMCGVTNVDRVMFKGVIQSNESLRCKWLQEVTDMFDE